MMTKIQEGEKFMKGFKVFNPDWTCKRFEFEVGKTFEQDVKPKCCRVGFHFCTKLIDCFNYYKFDPDNKVAEIEALGDIDANEDGSSKCCTNKIRIVRELPWNEVLDLVNTGFNNAGLGNTGGYNEGGYNSGDENSGNWNSGYNNSGNWNSGGHNDGNHNSGYWNSGNRNSGDKNSGDYNNGDFNSGNYNSGDHNSGDWNSGDYNTGHLNSGYKNSGNRNTGNRNSGNWNTGSWNSGNYNTGCFNTETPKINMFNKPSNWTLKDWFNSDAILILDQMPSTEKQTWWDNLPEHKKEIVMNLPNFDKNIFKEITGIEIKDKN